ncbi:MAG: glycosyltransferase family 1 protein [Acidobacteria bacterium]|nr:MAG: glycosyltransferase family 1 protein [Acidobacteriota bacterium]
MKTLHVDLGRQWRGGQNQALLLVQGLLDRGHATELIAVLGSPLARQAQDAGIQVHAVGHPGARLQASLQVTRLLKPDTFDAVHCHDAHGLTAAWIAGAHRRAPVVASRRVAYALTRNRIALSRYRSARKIIAVSRFVKDSVLASGLPDTQVEVVYDGVPLPPQAPRYRRIAAPPLIGCVGYLLPEKGQELLIRAMPLILGKNAGCRLILAGDGPSRAGLEQLARELKVGQAIQFAGHVEDVSQVYRALDVFLFPSLAEPLGSSLLAAMSHGLPVAAVAGGAVPEIVEDEGNGLLVAEPQASAMAGAVLRLLDDPELAARLGAAGRATIEERFTVGRMVEATLDVYQRL